MIPGCTGFHTIPITPETNRTVIENRVLDKSLLENEYPELATADMIDKKGWDLSCLTLMSYLYNSDITAAKAQWEMEQGSVMTSRERPNPGLSIAPGYNTTTDPEIISSWIVGSGLDLMFDVTGKRGIRIARAQYLSDAASLNLAGVAWEVRSNVRQGYVDVYAATHEHALLLETQSLLESRIETLRQLVGIGEIASTELALAQVKLDEISLAVQNAESRFFVARSELADAIGVAATSLDNTRLTFEELEGTLPDIPVESVRHEAMLNNTSLLKALAEYEASQKELELAVRNQFPNIQIGPGYEYDQGDDKWSVGVSLELPILTRHRGSIATAEGMRAEKAAKFDGVQTRLINAAESAVTRYESLLQNVHTADTLIDRISELVEQQDELHRIGELNRLDLIDIRLRLNSASLGLLASRLEAFGAMSDIEDAIQLPCFGASWNIETLQLEITGEK